MQKSLRTPEVRATFLRTLTKTGFISRAAAAVGISQSAVHQYRARHADFAAACKAAAAAPADKPGYARWTAAMEAVFLEALAETGSAIAAAARAGTTQSNAYRRRRREASFAAGWADAKAEASERLEDGLFEGALGGFVTVTERGGKVTTTRTQRPDAMFKMLDRRRVEPFDGGRTISLTAEHIAIARRKYERAIVNAVELDRARLAAAGLPELAGPPWHGLDPALATLKP